MHGKMNFFGINFVWLVEYLKKIQLSVLALTRQNIFQNGPVVFVL
jgi:hypothetical protein